MGCTWSGRGGRSTTPAQGGGSSRAAIAPALIFKLVAFLMSKFRQIFHRDSWKHKEQLFFLAQLQIPKGL
jgi:hypothetical protein